MEESKAGAAAGAGSPLDHWVRQRRSVLAAAFDPQAQGPGNVPPPGEDDPRWGLAFSGGGIRSATFCLGLASGLAKKGLFQRFDLLSTVSGGGYAGSAIGKLFNKRGATPAQVQKGLGDPGGTWFVWWLRATSRYLTPRGARDLVISAATYGRNMFAVHLELGLALMVLGGLVGLFNLFAWQQLYRWFAAHPDVLPAAGPMFQPWISTLWVAMGLPVLASIPLAAAYWTIPSQRGRRWVLSEVVLSLLLAALGLVAGAAALDGSLWGSHHDGALRAFCAGLAALMLLASPGPLVARLARPPREPAQKDEVELRAERGRSGESALRRIGRYAHGVLTSTVDTGASAEQRNRLTGWLANCVSVALLLLVLGVLDRAAWFVAFERQHYTYLLPVLLTVGFATARTLAVQLPTHEASTAVSGRLLFQLVEYAGWLLFGLLAVFWVALVYRVAVINLFAPPPLDELQFSEAMLLVLPFVALPLLYMAFTCNKADFANLSSLHNFYRARLTRSYLGAANPERFRLRTRGDGARAADPLGAADAEALVDVSNRRSVYEVDPADTVLLRDYQPQAHGGPVHILNVTVNQTHDPLGGLFNQDRKGQSLSITSAGHYRIGQEAWRHDASFAESQLPAWMAISGAAVAPGLGGQTSSGLAMLLFMAGVRLGYWWEMAPPASGLQALLSPTKYRLLFGEALARFGGTEDRFWYLSDGGHFENTAAYALLRERTRLMVVADAGADPAYAFEDLENLVRKVRIDLQAEIEFVDVDSAGESSLAFFGSLDQLRDPASSACMALARVRYTDGGRSWLVYVKPNIFGGLPIDLINYKRDNPTFPQEPTTDQFFGESQWESYFRLGRELGLQLERRVLEGLAREEDWLMQRVAQSAAAPVPGATPPTPKDKDLPFTVRYPRAVSLAKSGLSLGALAAVLTTTTQVWDKFSDSAQARRNAYWTEINHASLLHERLVVGEKATLPELTARLAALANTYCREGAPEVPVTPQITAIYSDVRERCSLRRDEAGAPMVTPACSVLADAKVRNCLAGGERLGRPVYWAVAYTDPLWAQQRLPRQGGDPDTYAASVPTLDPYPPALEPPAAVQAPVAASVTAATVAASIPRTARALAPVRPAAPALAPAGPDAASAGPASAGAALPLPVPERLALARAREAAAQEPRSASACDGKRVYVQIYSEEQRPEAQRWSEELRAFGARVPATEDVVATALRDGRNPPRPVPGPTLIFHTDDEQACAGELRISHGELTVRPLARGLVATRRVLELWLPPTVSGQAR
jgi:hypothetical protein